MATVIMIVSHQPIDIPVIFFIMQKYFLKYVVTPLFIEMRCSGRLHINKVYLLVM